MMLQCVDCTNQPLFAQLQLEERLFRWGHGAWWLYNASPHPTTAVLGYFQKRTETVRPTRLPILRRFSGGGAVIVGPGTPLSALITPIDNVLPPITRFYNAVRTIHPHLAHTENDFHIAQKKVAGHAIAQARGVSLLHTSWLFHYHPATMAALYHPPQEPSYRQGRQHTNFMGELRHFFSTPQALLQAVTEALKQHYTQVDVSWDEAWERAPAVASRMVYEKEPTERDS